jgi:anti-sigma factor RsiW
MADASLTAKQRDLLQRWFDGELPAEKVSEAEALVEDSQAAAAYVETLESMRQITRGLADEERGEPGWSVEETVSKAMDAPTAADEPLRELAPLLERYHDGEVIDAEAALVRRLRRRRDDVADYLRGLEQLGDAVRGADEASREGIDFDAQVHAVLEAVDSQTPAFDPDEHAAWLHRYADGELDAERRRIVEGWLEEDHPEVTDALETLDAIGQSTRAAFDEAGGQNIDLWDAVADAIDEDEDEASDESAEVFWLDDYRQGIAGAVAAALVLITVGALFGDRLFPWGERVVEKRTVVIVDSVEHSEGSSVLIDSPMQEAGASESAEESTKARKKTDDASEDEPTVIWLLDSDEKKDDAASGGTEDGSDQPDEAPAPDAGEEDAEEPPSGQPI